MPERAGRRAGLEFEQREEDEKLGRQMIFRLQGNVRGMHEVKNYRGGQRVVVIKIRLRQVKMPTGVYRRLTTAS